MAEPWILAVALELATAAASLFGWRRLAGMTRLVQEPRLVALARFFLWFALASVVHAVAAWQWEAGGLLSERAGFGLQDVLFWIHHALVAAAMVSAAMAFGPPRSHRTIAPAVAAVLLFAEPVLRLLESFLLLYLAARTAANHARRASMGSLEVAGGFFAILIGFALFLYNSGQGAVPLGARSPLGEAMVLLGMLVLALTPPGGRRASG